MQEFFLFLVHEIGLCRCLCFLLSLSCHDFIMYSKMFRFFFFFDRQRKNFIKKKIANPSTLGMYYGGKNQEPKLQWSSKTGREKQEKCDRATLQARRLCKKKDLISSKDRSRPSKKQAFLSLQIHHIKKCGTSLQKSILRCRPNLPCQDSNNSITISDITQCSPNKQNTNEHNLQAKGQWSKRWSTNSPHLLHMGPFILYINNTPIMKVIT